MKARPVRTLEEDKAASERTSDNREPNRSHVGGRGGMLSLPLVRCDQPHMKPRDLPYKDDRLREHPRIARFREDINALATHIGPRNVFHWNQLQASGTFIERRFAGLGYSPSRQTYTVQGQSFFNVEPKLEGTKHPDEVIVVGAHYDSHGPSPGANDNASGVAALL